ncbi:MAG TPA: hypothetical protein P5159_03700 [Phycisphaerae bacterium]|nr:hypothetical protein [Phycisphaerae bacterium]
MIAVFVDPTDTPGPDTAASAFQALATLPAQSAVVGTSFQPWAGKVAESFRLLCDDQGDDVRSFRPRSRL